LNFSVKRDSAKARSWQRRAKRLRPRSKKREARDLEWSKRKADLFIRDPHCRFPDCREPSYRCDAHHLLRLSWGGKDDLDNLVALCRGPGTANHHEWVHGHRPEAETLGLLRKTQAST
jgi:hypothetical protein